MIKSFVATNAKHLANFLSFVVTRCLAIAVFAISVPIFINQTSGEEYGIVAIGFSLLGLSTLLDVGIGFVITQSVGRSLARLNRRHAVIISQLYWVYLFTAIAISVSALTILSLFSTLSRDENIFYGWLALILPFLATSGTVAAVFQAHNDLVYLNGSRFLFEMAKSAAFLIAGLIFHSHVAIGPTLIAFAAIRAVIDVIYLNRRLGYSFSGEV
ncbi:MAG: hypothetical protein MPW17_05650 [Candidatus Manganitrophus sp.]|nr:hypothetical protein [Candidatus Manganitrophus sp.]WDT72319.1 MAG: hypothetical protein MPW17_05650 [Candidatus Manganitrophus sp.]